MKLIDIRKKPEGLTFDKTFDLKEQLLRREGSIIDLESVNAKGVVSFDDGLYLLNYQLSYDLTLPSSRSMTPVRLSEQYEVSEVFIAAADVPEKADLIDEHLVLILEDDQIDLSESILDHILLNIPLKVLTDEEKASEQMPEGKDWAVLTQEQYDAMKADQKQATNPFAALSDLFEENE